MLMDMFYSATKGIVKHRRRYHFHEVSLLLFGHIDVDVLYVAFWNICTILLFSKH